MYFHIFSFSLALEMCQIRFIKFMKFLVEHVDRLAFLLKNFFIIFIRSWLVVDGWSLIFERLLIFEILSIDRIFLLFFEYESIEIEIKQIF